MASIRKRNGKWQVQIRRHGVKPIARSFVKLADAKEWANHMECQADRRGLPADPKQLERTTLRALLARYKKEVVAEKKGKDVENIVINVFLRKSGLADLPLSGLTAEHFSKYRDRRLKKVKAATICRELGVIQHALDTARKEWSIPLQSNPLNAIRKPQVNNRRDIAAERDTINRRRLGHWIKRNANRIVDGKRFIRASGNYSAAVWRVELVS